MLTEVMRRAHLTGHTFWCDMDRRKHVYFALGNGTRLRQYKCIKHVKSDVQAGISSNFDESYAAFQ